MARRSNVRHWIRLTPLVAIVLGTAACAPSATTNAAQGTLTVDYSSLGSQNFIPALGTDYDKEYTDLTNEPLIYLQHTTLAYIPGLATSWSSSTDGLTWTFNIRHNVPFHPGNWGDVTAADVKFTIETAMGPTSTWYSLSTWKASLASIDTPSTYQVVIHLKSLMPTILSDLSSQDAALSILSQKYIDAKGLQYAETHPVGTGPYILSSQVRDSNMKFQEVGNWRIKPEFKYVVLNLVPEETTRIAQLEAGTADIIELDTQGLEELGKQPHITTQLIQDAWNLHMLPGGLYTDRKQYIPVPYADPRVRMAMSLAINRAELSKALFDGTAEPATSWGVYSFSDEIPNLPYNPTEAKQLLAAAHWPSNYTFTLYADTLPNVGDDTLVAEAIAGMLGQVGIKVNVEQGDLASLQTKSLGFQTTGDLLMNPSTLFLDPQAPWDVLFHCGAVYESFCDPKLDSLLDQLGQTINESQRITIEKEFQNQLINVDMADIPLVRGSTIFAVNTSDVANWVPTRGLAPINLEYATPPGAANATSLFQP
jgi:peptide/nickel transport system substrate-binding protein